MISDAVVAIVAALPYAERTITAGFRHLEKRRTGPRAITEPEETTDVSSVTLSDRQRCALLALDDLGAEARGGELAEKMTALGRETSAAAAHQAAAGLVRKGLAVRRQETSDDPVRYEITQTGWALAAWVRSGS